MVKYVADTNVLLDNIDALEGYDVIILSHVLRELDKHKSNSDKPDLAYRARKAVRFIKEHTERFEFDFKDYVWDIDDEHEAQYVDNMIIQACIENGYGLITRDGLLAFKAKGYNIEMVSVEEDAAPDTDYTGVYEAICTDEELSFFYSNINENIYELVQNQYLILKDKDGKIVDKLKWNGEEHVNAKFRKVSSRLLGDIKPRNDRQELLFNLLQDKSVTVKACFGKYGTGKDFCMISHAINMLETGQFDKIVFVRNQIPLRDAPESGFRKGDLFDKMIEYAMPLADHVGGIEYLKLMCEKGMVELQDLTRIRGRDLRNSIVYVTEVQNNTKDHLKLLIGRIGEGSQLWLNGDLKQVDKDIFKTNSGVLAASTLRGNALYGQVTLDKTERSKTAELAELI